MKVIVISGFLGAGKTTFIKELANRTKQQLCVLENEFAGSEIDKVILESDDIKVWELTEGCICCSLKTGFVESVIAISERLNPEYLIVEATGIGYLSNIIANVQKIEHSQISLLNAITIVDAETVKSGQYDRNDISVDQIKTANVIVVSKCENLSEDERRGITSELRKLNHSSEIVTTHYSDREASWWDKLLHTYLDGHVDEQKEESTENWDHLTIMNVEIPSLPRLVKILHDIVRGEYGYIQRAKGIVRCGAHWNRFDIVGTKYIITGIDAHEKSNAVFIGMQFDSKQLWKQFPESRRKQSHAKHNHTHHLHPETMVNDYAHV